MHDSGRNPKPNRTPAQKRGMLVMAASTLLAVASVVSWGGAREVEFGLPLPSDEPAQVYKGLDSSANRELLVAFRPTGLPHLDNLVQPLAEMPAFRSLTAGPQNLLWSPEDLSADELAFCEGLAPRVGIQSYRVGPQDRFALGGSFERFLVHVAEDASAGASIAQDDDRTQPVAKRCRIVEGEVRVALDDNLIWEYGSDLDEPSQALTFGDWWTTDAAGEWTLVTGRGVPMSWGSVELENRYSADQQGFQEAAIRLRDVELSAKPMRVGIRRDLLDPSTNEVIGYALAFFDFDCM